MKKLWSVAPLLGAALLSATSLAHAHRSWLLPSTTLADGKGSWVTFDAAVSDDFFNFSRSSVNANGLVITGPDGKTVEASKPHVGKLRTTFDVQLPQEGTYRASIINEGAMAFFKQGTESKRLRGASLDELKKAIPADAKEVRITVTAARLDTFVTAGMGNDVALRADGKGLEVVPVTHPEDFTPGSEAKFRVTLNGKPVADTVVSVTPGGVRYRGILREQTLKSDAQGEFKVTWPDAGMYAIATSYPPRAEQPAVPVAPAASTAPNYRYTYAGTLEVLPQ